MLSCNIICQRLLFTHSFDTHQAARQQWSSSIHARLQRVHSGVGINRGLYRGCCRALPLCGSLHTGKPLTTSLSSLSLSLCGCVSLSLSASLRLYNKSRHVPTRHQQPAGCMSLLLDQRGRSRGSQRGETQKKKPA